ncbi:hypothetical protein OKHIL_01190 [Mycolicibacterium mageritense]
MTGLAQSATATDASECGESIAVTEPIPVPGPGDQETPRPTGGRLVTLGLVCGATGAAAIAWFVFLGPGELGSRSEWFFGAVVFVVALVTIWQTHTIQRQANRDAADAAERLRRELAAADERSALELALTKKWHRAELEAQQKSHRAELDAQRALARAERTQLVGQLQRQAMIEVSRAVGAHTRMLATLWSEGARILGKEDRDEREAAMNAIFEQIAHVVNEVSVELDNAYLLSEDTRLNHALDRVNDAVLMAIQVAEELHTDVIEGRVPETNPVTDVGRLMHEQAAEARRLAWALIRTGLQDSAD